MTLRAPRHTFSLDPLFAEEKRRMRRRPVLVALIALLGVGAVAGAAYVLHSGEPPGSSKQPGRGGHASSMTLAQRYSSALGWSIRLPSGMHVEHSSAGGIGFGVDEATFGNFRIQKGVRRRFTSNGSTIWEVPPRSRLGVFPTHGIAVRVLWLFSHRPWLFSHRPATPFPLRLSSFHRPRVDWYPGTLPRPLQHVVVAKRQRYLVQVWVGSKASSQQRALLARMIASLSFRRAKEHPVISARTG